jgi:hypothetical protein
MKNLVIFLCLLATSCFAADKVWLTGKLLDDSTSTVQTYSQSNGNGQTWNHAISDIAIDAGDRIYFARGVASFRWSKVPKVTENAPIQYRINKDNLYIIDDKGKEIKLSLTKTRMKDSPLSSR